MRLWNSMINPFMNEDIFTIPEGQVRLWVPKELSQESYDLLLKWMEIVIEKIRKQSVDVKKE